MDLSCEVLLMVLVSMILLAAAQDNKKKNINDHLNLDRQVYEKPYWHPDLQPQRNIPSSNK